MSDCKITIDLHESGRGFQIVFDGLGARKVYPEPITDIQDALECAFGMQIALAEETGIVIPERDVCVTHRAVEYNAMSSPNNLNVYRDLMSGKIKPQED